MANVRRALLCIKLEEGLMHILDMLYVANIEVKSELANIISSVACLQRQSIDNEIKKGADSISEEILDFKNKPSVEYAERIIQDIVEWNDISDLIQDDIIKAITDEDVSIPMRIPISSSQNHTVTWDVDKVSANNKDKVNIHFI